MANDLPLLNEEFISSGNITSPLSLEPQCIHRASVHQVVTAILASKRGGNAQTKTRAEVRGGGAKPHKQKGTGRARQGSTRAPNRIGGGRAFGPRRRDWTQKVNKKVAKKAIHSVLADKYQAGKLTIVESLTSNGKTKDMFTLLNTRGFLPALVITGQRESLALRALGNLREAKGLPVEAFSVYEAVKYENLIMEKEAFETLAARIGKP